MREQENIVKKVSCKEQSSDILILCVENVLHKAKGIKQNK